MESIRSAQRTLASVGLITDADGEAALGRVTTTADPESECSGVGLVIEAITENLERKQALFGRLDPVCGPDALFVSNTSGLSISEIAEGSGRPDRFAGLHFWNPAHIIPLVEVTRGEATSEETADRLVELCRAIGKRPILVRSDIPGFVGNRLQFAVLREALHLVESGVVSAEDVDTAMTAGPGLRYGCLGPLRTADLGGLDVFHAISSYLFEDLDASKGASPLLGEHVAAGELGAKSGRGFYEYSADDLSEEIGRRDRILLGFLEVLRREQ